MTRAATDGLARRRAGASGSKGRAPRIDMVRRAEIGHARRLRTRAGLLAAARSVVAARGFDACTIDEFITAAGVARGTFYNYFKDREQVIEAVAQDVLDSLKAEIARVLRGVKDPARRIAQIMSYCIAKAVQDPTWGAMMLHMMSTGPHLGNAMHREFDADLKAGLAAGRFKFESLSAALDLVKGATLFGMRSMVRKMESPMHAGHIAAMALRGLGLNASEARAVAKEYSDVPG